LVRRIAVSVRVLATIKVLVRRSLPMMAVAIFLTPLVSLSFLLAFFVTEAIANFIPWVSVQADRRFADALFVLFLTFCYCLCFAATPVCTVEQNSIGVRLSRVRFLTEGHRRQICGIVPLIAFIDVIVGTVANMAVRGIGAYANLIRADPRGHWATDCILYRTSHLLSLHRGRGRSLLFPAADCQGRRPDPERVRLNPRQDRDLDIRWRLTRCS